MCCFAFDRDPARDAPGGAGRRAASPASLSASSLPGMPTWPGDHITWTLPGAAVGRILIKGHLEARCRNSRIACCEVLEGVASRRRRAAS